jgi:hypothetical protein
MLIRDFLLLTPHSGCPLPSPSHNRHRTTSDDDCEQPLNSCGKQRRCEGVKVAPLSGDSDGRSFSEHRLLASDGDFEHVISFVMWRL